MTSYEKQEFSKWNKNITTDQHIGIHTAREIETKYLRLNGSRSCNPETFILEIAETIFQSREEKIQDIGDYLSYIRAVAKAEALYEILHIYH